MIVGFTGTQALLPSEIPILERVIDEEVTDEDTMVTGACIGVDERLAVLGMARGHTVYTIVPANRSKVDPFWRMHCVACEEMPMFTSYRDRNQRIVDMSDRLIAFPAYAENHPKSLRSGTWMTVRIAQRAGIPVAIHILRRDA
jgi:hypothetical protein